VHDIAAGRRTEHLTGRRLVEARAGALLADRVEQVHDGVRVRVPGGARVVEGRADAALACQVV